MSNRWRESMLCQIWAYGGSLSKVQLQLSSSKITDEFVGKLTRFPVQFLCVFVYYISVYVFNNIIISHPFPGGNVKGACTVNYCVKNPGIILNMLSK